MHYTHTAASFAIQPPTSELSAARTAELLAAVSRLTAAQVRRARAERSLTATKAGSPWHRRYLEEHEAAALDVAAAKNVLSGLNGEREAAVFAAAVTDIPVCRFRVKSLDKLPDSTGRYPEVLDMPTVNAVRVRFFRDAALSGVRPAPGMTGRVTMPGCLTYEVEVL